jgi:hypothetical protein
VIAFNEAGVRKLMTRYGSYYEKARTHLALDKDAPIPRPVMPPCEGDIVAIREVGGLHDRYTNVERRDRAGTCCTRATSRLRSTRGDSEAH